MEATQEKIEEATPQKEKKDDSNSDENEYIS